MKPPPYWHHHLPLFLRRCIAVLLPLPELLLRLPRIRSMSSRFLPALYPSPKSTHSRCPIDEDASLQGRQIPWLCPDGLDSMGRQCFFLVPVPIFGLTGNQGTRHIWFLRWRFPAPLPQDTFFSYWMGRLRVSLSICADKEWIKLHIHHTVSYLCRDSNHYVRV